MLLIVAQTIPIELDADGVARVGKTPVTLDTVVSAFNQGATAEEIVCLQHTACGWCRSVT